MGGLCQERFGGSGGVKNKSEGWGEWEGSGKREREMRGVGGEWRTRARDGGSGERERGMRGVGGEWRTRARDGGVGGEWRRTRAKDGVVGGEWRTRARDEGEWRRELEMTMKRDQ